MENVMNFISWALKRAKKASVPSKAVLAIDRGLVGSEGEAEYLWGTSGRTVTEALLDARWKSYYKPHNWTETDYKEITDDWVAKKKRVSDCQGLLDWYLGNDTNANGNYKNYCTDKGLCAAISRPYVIGEAVFNGTDSKKTHVGWVCGFMPDGEALVVEERGLAYGCVITRMSKRKWKYRGLMTKKFSYEETTTQPETEGSFAFTRQLKYGRKGDDVIELKKLLIKAGYGKGITTDTSSSRNFYGTTRTRVKEYQRDNGLTVDGIAGPNTLRSLGGNWQG